MCSLTDDFFNEMVCFQGFSNILQSFKNRLHAAMEDLIRKFYAAFAERDAAAMNACYHEDIVFSDPAFGTLKGNDARAMWAMLCENAQDLTVEVSDIKARGNKGSAHWEAQYSFSRTGRRVHNKIDARFKFQDGKIIKHEDTFNLHKWASQAMGWRGWLFGKTPFFAKKLQQQTNKMLASYKERNGIA